MSEIKTASVRNTKAKYAFFGKGQRKLVILPGLSVRDVSDTADMLEQLHRRFVEHYTVYVIDRIRDVPAGYTLSQMAEDAYAVMKAAGIDRCDIFAASQGGMLAMYIASKYPDAVGKMVLASTAPIIPESCRMILDEWRSTAVCGDRQKLAKIFADCLFSEDAVGAAEKLLKEQSATYSDVELERFVRLCDVMNGQDLEKMLKDIKAETFVIGAEGDRLFPGELQRRYARKLHAEVFMYTGKYAHAVYDEAPDFRDRVLSCFLGRPLK